MPEGAVSGGSAIPTIRIFLSSPGDVAEERAVALASIRRLQGWFQGRLVLAPILWEQEPLLATAGFQHEIDRRAPPSRADVALFVIWSRLGTPLSRDFVLEDGSRPTGTEWEFHEASVASRERELPHILVYRKTAKPLLDATHREEALAGLTHYQAVERFFQQHFRDARDLSFKGSFHQFRDASEFGQLLETHLTSLLGERVLGAHAPEVTWHGSPFRGLKPFEAEHARVFFGRTRAIQQARQALSAQVRAGRAFLLILGPSGTGKSSLAKAGLLPLLSGPWVIEPALVGGACRTAVTRPGDGATPLEALATALLAPAALPDLSAQGGAADLARAWTASSAAAVNDVRGALGRAAGSKEAAASSRLVLLVDQLEELFTRSGTSSADVDAYERVLEALATSGLAWVVATLRSDFYPALTRLKRLTALKQGAGQYDLAPPDAAEIAQIVRLPAQVAGLAYETDPESGRSLDETLIAEATTRPDLLPMLQFTLQSLYEACPGGPLTRAAYARLGGIEGSLRVQAEGAWERSDEQARAAFPALLRALVEVPSEGAFRPTARRAARQDLARVPGAEGLVDALVQARLLVADGDGEAAVVSVSHESLFRVWDRAREQLLAEGDLLRIHGRLRSRAQRWEDRGRRADLLLQAGEELAEVERLLRERFSLGPRELAFVQASQRRARAVAWGKRVALAAIVLFGGVAVVLGLSADRARREADASAQEARVQQRAAESGRIEAEASRREAERQRGVAEEVNRFLNQDLLGSVTQGADDVQLTVGQLLDRAAEKIQGRFDDRPEVEGPLRQTIAAAYYALGRMSESAQHAERALALAEAVHGPESLAAADALELLALATRVDDERQFARALAIRAALLGERHPLTLRVHGYLAMSQGDSLANPAWLDVLARVRAKGESREQVADWARRLTLAVDASWRERGRDETLALIAAEAAPVTRHAQFGTSATWALAGYALRVAQDGLLDAGEAFATWAYQHGVERHGRRNAHTRWALSVLTQILVQRGEPERTLPVLKAAYDLELEDADREAISVDVVTWYADALRRAGRPGEAVKVCGDVIQRVAPEGPLPLAARLVVLELARALADLGEREQLDALLARCAEPTAAFVRERLEDR